MSLQRKKAKDMGIEFTANFINIEEDAMINSDEQRVMQVLLNIQANALKFTEKGTVKIQVSTFKKDEDSYLKIEVIDSGIGIKEEDKDKLFRLFGFVQDSKQMNTSGIGLGLVISEQIVKKLQGSISFVSKENVGSTFTFNVKLIHDPSTIKKRTIKKGKSKANNDGLNAENLGLPAIVRPKVIRDISKITYNASDIMSENDVGNHNDTNRNTNRRKPVEVSSSDGLSSDPEEEDSI